MVLKDKNKLKTKKMAGRFLQEIYPVLIERDSKGNIISREEMDERRVNFVPRVGEIISADTLEFYQDEEGNNEQTEDGRNYVREVEFFRVIAVIHEACEGRTTRLALCTNVILEKVKGDELRFLTDCTYDKGLYFVDPKNFK
jgi:predicted methyltransferase